MSSSVNAWDSVAPISPAVCRTADDVRALARRMARRPAIPVVRFRRPAPIEIDLPKPKPKPFLFPFSEPFCHKAIALMWTLGKPKRVTTWDIQNAVCEKYRLTIDDLQSPYRNVKIVRPRQIAMYLSRKMTPRSLPEIGKSFGGRDHTTVLHAVRKVESLMLADPALAGAIDDIRRGLMA